ncbi:HD domain-containing protein [Propionicicella superfundia]|uniref:HD domain-containing protein n=1 Tax=Propionicicella superfundia TaxID=348582 RepID=UPI000419B1FF|nr:hypothetical protein [Propionicicella superfundia]
MSLQDDLRLAWEETLPGRPGLGEELWRRWTEPHRRYHDPRHLAETLVALAVVGGDAGDPRVTRLAVWFHDAVLTGAADDEQRSADLATSRLAAAGVGGADVEEVCRLILVTRHHRPAAGDASGAAVSDADLAILAGHPDRYDESVRDLRRERTHLGLAWRTWREPLLRARLAADVYFTVAGRSAFASDAVANMRRELAAASGTAVRRRASPT